MEQISYNEAIAELQEIVQEIESSEVELDLLTEKLKRAATLIAICKNKLKKTDKEVEKLLKEIE